MIEHSGLSAAEILQIIAALTTLVAAIGAAVSSVLNGRKIEKVHLATNGMKDALIESTRAAANAEGKEAGRAEATAEHRKVPPS
jgi:hypothetical protein